MQKGENNLTKKDTIKPGWMYLKMHLIFISNLKTFTNKEKLYSVSEKIKEIFTIFCKLNS